MFNPTCHIPYWRHAMMSMQNEFPRPSPVAEAAKLGENNSMKTVRNSTAVIFLFAFAAFGFFQLTIFGQNAYKVTYIYALEMMGFNSAANEATLGRICDSLGRYHC